MQVLRTADRDEWLAVLGHFEAHDFYHLPQYHTLAEERGEGEGRLFVYRENERVIALPLMVRPLHTIPGLETAGVGQFDATSVYGYAGPIASHADLPAEMIAGFQRALRETLQAMGVVTVFSRLHPLFPQQTLLAGLGECAELGRTVSINLTVPLETQRAGYRRNHRRDLKSLAEAGVTCFHDEKLEHLDAFITIYHEAMNRLDASEGYYFSREYFHALFAKLGGTMQLFICMLDGQPISGGAFAMVGGIAQAHLAGCRDEHVRLGPLKQLYDTASLWARERGCRVLHMGGGVGSREDALFNFKIGFSKCLHRFATWRWLVASEDYERLCRLKSQWNADNGLRSDATPFFPAYRTATAPVQDATDADGIAVFGAGGHAKVVISTITACGGKVAGIFDDDPTKWGEKVLGHTVCAPHLMGCGDAVIAIGDNAERESIARNAKCRWQIVVHPSAQIHESVRLGAGTVVFAGAIIQPDAVLGEHVIVNTGATIDHDCSIGSFVHIAPGVHLAGHVQLGCGAFLGIGCVVLPGRKIGAWTTVGAGAVVIADLPDSVVAYGVPAKPKRPATHRTQGASECPNVP